MKEGLLWFDDDPRRHIDDKVRQAAARYRQKYGSAPDVCYVNAQAIDQDELRVDNLRVLPAPSVRPHHLWVGRSG